MRTIGTSPSISACAKSSASSTSPPSACSSCWRVSEATEYFSIAYRTWLADATTGSTLYPVLSSVSSIASTSSGSDMASMSLPLVEADRDDPAQPCHPPRKEHDRSPVDLDGMPD